MKKITLLLMAVLVWVGSVSAQDAQSLLTFKWAHTVEGAANAANNVFESKKAADGSYLVATKVGTKTGALTAKFDDATIEGFEGGTYKTAATGNLFLQKVGVDGKVVWSLHSTKCDVSSVNIAPTSDGGAVLAVKSRANGTTQGFSLVDAAGKSVAIDDMKEDAYYLVLVKVDANGNCLWTRLQPGSKGTISDSFTINDCTVDENDNVYLVGKVKGDFSFSETIGGAGVDLLPNNASSNLVVMKFNSDGKFVNVQASGTETASSTADRVVYHDGKLYVVATVTGQGMTVGEDEWEKPVEADAALPTLFLMAINADNLADVTYVKSLSSIANKAKKPTLVVQNKALSYVNGNLYLTGAVNGGLSADGVTVDTEGNMLKGFILKANAEDGTILAMGINDKKAAGITNYFGVYEGDNTIYTLGYDMAQTKSAILFTYNKSDLSKTGELSVSNLASGAICAPMLVDDNRLLLMSRGKATPLTFVNTDTQLNGFSDWGSMYCLYTISDVPTAIKNISSVVNGTDKVDVYSINGVRVKTAVSAENAVQNLAKGIYVVGNKKVVVK